LWFNCLQDNDAKVPSAVIEQDKIERMRLKKQRQKERRKEKKAIAATNQKTKIKLERFAEKEKSLLIEKTKKSKEKHPIQSFRTMHKGVKYLDLVVGKGPTVQHRKKVRVSYTLRAKSHTTGKVLDSSHNFGFRLGKGEVIQGWDIGLEGMRMGGVRRLIVPPLAGYGNSKDVGAGRGGDLFFEIELLHVAS
jgi:FKBP-type peptidyl-prolyl cis-trans isomerase